ncbi:hypothetical protein BDV93DRAFT_541612 [Ceratobasidium sp. AG-I]|nr:hypothetical protein BDV93DRAFT_541612 [Ceratobasidium sp. AG-I]
MSSPPERNSGNPSSSSNSTSNPKPKPAPPANSNIQKDHSEYYSNYKPGSSEIYRSWNARTLPERAHFPKTDERCVFYCTQGVEDRYRARRPVCYTLCWRRVFPHESHQVAKAPQALSWAEYWSVASRTRPGSTSEEGQVKEWAPLAGRYIYFSRGRYVATRHMFGMKGSGVPSPVNFVPGKGDDAPLPLDDKASAVTANDPLRKTGAKTAPPLQPETYEKVIALGPLPYEIADSVRGGFDKLFGPTERLLSRGVKIWDDGAPIRVAKNLYELALAGEPLALAGKAVDLIIRSSRGNGGSGANP